MTTIPPALQPVSSPAAGSQAPVTATPVSDVPAEIASLPPNSTIEATVAAAQAATQAAAQAQAKAVVQLITQLGNLTVRLPMPVPPDATLKLQVLGSGANLQLRVIALNGQPLPGAGLAPSLGAIEPLPLPPLAGPLAGTAPATPGVLQGPAPSPVSNPLATGIAAETLPTPAANSGLQATVVFGTEAAIPNGTQLTVRLLDILPPGATTGLPSATPEPGAALPPIVGEPRPGVLPGPLPNTGALPAATDPEGALPPGATVPASPGTVPASPDATTGPSSAMTTPGASAPSLPVTTAPDPAAALPATLSGTVAPNSLGGQPLVQTPIGLLSLSGAPDLPPGSQVTLQTVGPPTPPAPVIAASPSATQAQPSGWANFSDTMVVLQKADPGAVQVLVQRLPDLGPQFVSNLVTWVAAAQTGDIRAWLGERTVKALEKAGRADLIDKLGDDLDGMKSTVRLPQLGNDWQALTLPLFFGQRIERVRLSVRRAKGEEDGLKGGDEEGLRFLLDVDMSQLGALQLDGLVKRQAKHFDLIVRSRLELPEQVRRDINSIFTRSLDGFGMTGGAVFKQTAAFIEPLPIPTTYAGLTA